MTTRLRKPDFNEVKPDVFDCFALGSSEWSLRHITALWRDQKKRLHYDG